MSKPEPGEDDRRPRNGKNASPWHRARVAQGPRALQGAIPRGPGFHLLDPMSAPVRELVHPHGA